MDAHPTLLEVGLFACLLHCLVQGVRWYRAGDVCAIGVYSLVFPNLPNPEDPACVQLVREVARTDAEGSA
jgi:hypothetical protein